MLLNDILAERVRTLRQAKGMNQEHLAYHAGTCARAISTIEQGKGNPTLLSLLSLADALGTTVVELIEEDKASYH